MEEDEKVNDEEQTHKVEGDYDLDDFEEDVDNKQEDEEEEEEEDEDDGYMSISDFTHDKEFEEF